MATDSTSSTERHDGPGPLAGVRVLELGNFIAGPFAGQLFGDYGAEVIKIESPQGGDTMRRWGVCVEGESLWWPTIGRNKRSVAIDLHRKEGRELVCELARHSDIVLENFRAGRLGAWELDHASLAAENPRLVTVHVSGYGQTGPMAQTTSFGSIGEAMGGIRHTTGSPDRPPSRTGVSLGDSLAAMFAVIGGLAAHTNAQRTGVGQEVDVAIYESVFALMESILADYELAGIVRERSGASLPGVAPSNAYTTGDEREILIAANADTVFRRLCEAMGRPELADDPRFVDHAARGRNQREIDGIVEAWTRSESADRILGLLAQHSVPAGRIFTAPDMLADSHFGFRKMILRHPASTGQMIPMPGIVPAFSQTPGEVRFAGRRLGEDTRSVLREVAGLSDERLDELEASGVCLTGQVLT